MKPGVKASATPSGKPAAKKKSRSAVTAQENPALPQPEADPVLVAELKQIARELKKKGYKPKYFPPKRGARIFTVSELFGLDDPE